MYFLSLLISPWLHLVVWCGLFLVSLLHAPLKKYTFTLFRFALTIGFIMFFTGLMKLGFAKSRPDPLLNDFRSFPSSHAAIAFGLAYLLKRPKYYFLAVPLVATRILLGRHDFIDVVGGSFVGLLTAALFYYLTQRFQKQIEQAIGLLNLG